MKHLYKEVTQIKRVGDDQDLVTRYIRLKDSFETRNCFTIEGNMLRDEGIYWLNEEAAYNYNDFNPEWVVENRR